MNFKILLMIYKSDWYDKKENKGIRDKIKYYSSRAWISKPVQWDEELSQYYLNFCNKEDIEINLKNLVQEHEVNMDYQNPVRTLEDWEAARRTPPGYIPRLIAYQLKYEELLFKTGCVTKVQ